MAFPTGWNEIRKITIDNTKVSGSGNLTDFPVLIKDGNIPSDVYSALKLGTHSLDLENGSSQSVSIADGAQTGLDPTGDFSFEIQFWVENLPTTLNEQYALFNKWSTSAGNYSYLCQFSNTSDKLQLLYSGDGTNFNSFVTDDAFLVASDVGKFVHIAVTVDASAKVVTIYKNATSVPVTLSSGTQTSVYDGTADFQMSVYNSDDYIDGKIKNARFFSDIRTATEVAEGMNSNSITNANLEGEWAFDNAYTDGSGNGNTLTPSGAPSFVTDVPSLSNQLRFSSDEAGSTEIPFEVVSFDSVGETCEIWVKVPTVDYDDDTLFYMWYDNDAVAGYAVGDTYGRNAVWDDYAMVLHLGDGVTTGVDSTGNSHDATHTSITEEAIKIGNGAKYSGGTSFSTLANKLSTFWDNAYTLQMWTKPTTLDTTNGDCLFWAGDRNQQHIITSGGNPELSTYDGTANSVTSTATLVNGTAYLLHFQRINSSTGKIYVDGVDTTSASPMRAQANDPSADMRLGSREDYVIINYTGSEEEIRLRASALSSDWIATEKDNQNAPSTFLAITSLVILIDLSETITISDTLSTPKTTSKDLSETITITDVIDSTKVAVMNLFETINITDTYSRVIDYVRTFTETITVTDTFTKLHTAVRTFIETITITDAFSKTQGKNFSETIKITDTIRKYVNGFLQSIWSKIAKPTTTYTKTAKPDNNIWTKQEKPEV